MGEKPIAIYCRFQNVVPPCPRDKKKTTFAIIRNSIGIVNTSLTFPDCLTFLQLVETSVSSYNFLCESGTTN